MRIETLPGSLPKHPIPENVDAAAAAQSISHAFNGFQASHFVSDAIWRDIFALTGDTRTFYDPANIIEAWNETSQQRQVKAYVLDPASATVTRHPTGPAWISVRFHFESKAAGPSAQSSGYAQLVTDESGEWKIWVIRTILQQITGEHSVDELEAGGKGINADVDISQVLDCAVIGGGAAGLSVSGRLKALGLSYLCIDNHKLVGDNWKLRYDAARLHTVREYGHLPFSRTFDKSYQEFLDTTDLQNGYTHFANQYGLNIWQSTTFVSGDWHQDTGLWKLKIVRDGQPHELIARSIVLCVGIGGRIPTTPQWSDRELFRGITVHSKDFKNAKEWKGLQGVVVGTANTGHDVAEEMERAGLTRVTMLQRSPTYILPVPHYKIASGVLYNDKLPTKIADELHQTGPIRISSLAAGAALNAMADANPALYDGLDRAGFKAKRHGNILEHVYNRGGGHYMDVGASAKIADGRIKVKADARPVKYTEKGILFDDNTELPTDVIVFATGFERSMRPRLKEWFGEKLAGSLAEYGGLDDEGEPKGVARPTGHPALWYHGRELGTARYFSRFVALQVKARAMGTPFRTYSRRFPIDYVDLDGVNGSKVNGHANGEHVNGTKANGVETSGHHGNGSSTNGAVQA